MYSFQNTLFGNVTSTANTQHMQPQQTRQLVVYQLSSGHQQPHGHQQHNPQRVRNTAETSTKRPAVLREDTDLYFFFWLACFRHSMMVLPGYINKNAPICYAGWKNRPLCLTVKLLTCSVELADDNCDANVSLCIRATCGLLHLWRIVMLLCKSWANYQQNTNRVSLNDKYCVKISIKA